MGTGPNSGAMCGIKPIRKNYNKELVERKFWRDFEQGFLSLSGKGGVLAI